MHPTSIRLPTELEEKVTSAAKAVGKSKSEFIISILAKHFETTSGNFMPMDEFNSFVRTLNKIVFETEDIKKQFIEVRNTGGNPM